MRLKQDPVDLFEIHGSNLIADGLEQGAEAECSMTIIPHWWINNRHSTRTPQEALPGTHDEGHGLSSEGVVTQPSLVHLGEPSAPFRQVHSNPLKTCRAGFL